MLDMLAGPDASRTPVRPQPYEKVGQSKITVDHYADPLAAPGRR